MFEDQMAGGGEIGRRAKFRIFKVAILEACSH
jgi:hypothetical protein